MTRNAFETVYEMVSAVTTEVLAAAERVRLAENSCKSIRVRHLRVGRGLVGIHCLSDAQIPLEFALRERTKSKDRVTSASVVENDALTAKDE